MAAEAVASEIAASDVESPYALRSVDLMARHGCNVHIVCDHIERRFADNLHDWGEALLSNGELDEAVKKFSMAVSISGDRHGPSRIGWGIALYCKGDVRGAHLELDRARGLSGNDELAPCQGQRRSA